MEHGAIDLIPYTHTYDIIYLIESYTLLIYCSQEISRSSTTAGSQQLYQLSLYVLQACTYPARRIIVNNEDINHRAGFRLSDSPVQGITNNEFLMQLELKF